MRIIVCGGREYSDVARLRAVLDEFHGNKSIEHVAHGDARGVDRWAAAWAQKHGITTTSYPADWQRYGRAAGPIRNREMLRAEMALGLTMVVAFPGGKGTRDMCSQACAAGVMVYSVA